MSSLQQIGVKLETGEQASTGNPAPLLHEIGHALERLLRDGEPTLIDLTTLPLTPADLEQLLAALGRGEVEIRLDALGESHIRETSYAGVWLVEHYRAGGSLMTRHIEVCTVPSIVQSQREDIEYGLQRLRDSLAAAPT